MICFCLKFLSADVLFITLTVYLNQPLPLADEVLMCTSNTTKDEVYLLLLAVICVYN